AVGQRERSGVVRDRLTVRIRPAAPADFAPDSGASVAPQFCNAHPAVVPAPAFAGTTGKSRHPRPLIPAHSASKTRVDALLLGIQGPQPVALGPALAGTSG